MSPIPPPGISCRPRKSAGWVWRTILPPQPSARVRFGGYLRACVPRAGEGILVSYPLGRASSFVDRAPSRGADGGRLRDSNPEPPDGASHLIPRWEEWGRAILSLRSGALLSWHTSRVLSHPHNPIIAGRVGSRVDRVCRERQGSAWAPVVSGIAHLARGPDSSCCSRSVPIQVRCVQIDISRSLQLNSFRSFSLCVRCTNTTKPIAKF